MFLLTRCLLIISCIFWLTACNPTVGSSTSSQNIKRSQTTNEVTLSNLNLAIAYMKERSYEKALEKLEKAKEADPNYSPVYNMFGLLYQTLGDNAQAETYFKKAININYNDSSTLNNYGRFLCQQKRIDEAEETFQRAADNPLYTTPEIAITNAGLCTYNNDRKEIAENYFREALQLNPRMPPALLMMSEISFNQNNALSARGYLQRYQQVSKHNAKSLWLGIQIENELGDKDAVSSYALSLRNNFPDSEEAAKLRESRIQ